MSNLEELIEEFLNEFDSMTYLSPNNPQYRRLRELRYQLREAIYHAKIRSRT